MGLSAIRNLRTMESLNFIFQTGKGHKVTKGGIFPRKCWRDFDFCKLRLEYEIRMRQKSKTFCLMMRFALVFHYF